MQGIVIPRQPGKDRQITDINRPTTRHDHVAKQEIIETLGRWISKNSPRHPVYPPNKTIICSY
jgi:hypothetical protein